MLRCSTGRWLVAAVGAGLLLPGCVSHEHIPTTPAAILGRPTDVPATATIGPAITPLEKAGRPAEMKPSPEEERLRLKGLKVDVLQIPSQLPGAEAQLPLLPPPNTPRKEAAAALEKVYPKLVALGAELLPVPGPGGRPLTLADLQRIAAANSPVMQRATAAVAAARGAMIQAGAYPNPTVGYQASSIGPGGGPMVGGAVQQTIKTAGKLKLAQAAAEMDLRTAEVALRAAHNDLTTAVRNGYFAVLVAQEGVLISRALVDLTYQAFRQQVEIAKAGEAANYEPLQIYVQAEQARATLIQARNRYISAWEQLTATLSVPRMHPTLLAGRPDTLVPHFDYARALAYILANHTDIRTAELAIQKARYNLRLAEVTPVPDVTVSATILDDLSPPGPFNWTVAGQVGVTLPVWDQNRGGILQAQGQLALAADDLKRAQNDLRQRLADAYERYRTNREQVRIYRDNILGNQVIVYRRVRLRYHTEPEKIAFADIFTTQQALATALAAYLSNLQAMWTAVVDVANLLQTDDLYLQGQEPCGAAGPRPADLLQPPPTAAQAPAPADGAAAPERLPPPADESEASPPPLPVSLGVVHAPASDPLPVPDAAPPAPGVLTEALPPVPPPLRGPEPVSEVEVPKPPEVAPVGGRNEVELPPVSRESEETGGVVLPPLRPTPPP
jgi:cobalt-zinc-cadmium efflux system outer membrane protein